MKELQVKNTKITLFEGDITEHNTDAIVNAANSALKLGAGVAGAIREKGGPEIQEECNRIGSTGVGTAVLTTGGKLKAKYVIHAVGPHLGENDADEKLASATRHSLLVAERNNLQSITFPAISTGVFGYPYDRCAEIMLDTVAAYLQGTTSIKEVRFCLWGDEAYGIFVEKLAAVAKKGEQ